jgi:hypothetical protein
VASTGEELNNYFSTHRDCGLDKKITGVLVIAQAVSRYTCQAKALYDKAFGASAGGRCLLITTCRPAVPGGVLYTVLSDLFNTVVRV